MDEKLLKIESEIANLIILLEGKNKRTKDEMELHHMLSYIYQIFARSPHLDNEKVALAESSELDKVYQEAIQFEG